MAGAELFDEPVASRAEVHRPRGSAAFHPRTHLARRCRTCHESYRPETPLLVRMQMAGRGTKLRTYPAGSVGVAEKFRPIVLFGRAREVCSDGADGVQTRALWKGGGHVHPGERHV